jgi:hypothetical protein
MSGAHANDTNKSHWRYRQEYDDGNRDNPGGRSPISGLISSSVQRIWRLWNPPMYPVRGRLECTDDRFLEDIDKNNHGDDNQGHDDLHWMWMRMRGSKIKSARWARTAILPLQELLEAGLSRAGESTLLARCWAWCARDTTIDLRRCSYGLVRDRLHVVGSWTLGLFHSHGVAVEQGRPWTAMDEIRVVAQASFINAAPERCLCTAKASMNST